MFKLKDVKNLDYKLISGSDNIELTDVCFDSRHIVKGCVFVCLKGANFDSHDVIGDVVAAGAAAIVISHDTSYPDDVTVISVDDSRTALGLLSAAHFGYPSEKLTCIGVTGTKGKTTTTHMVKKLLEQAGHSVGLIGTNGIFIRDERIPTVNTTPESYDLHKACAQMIDAGCDYMVMEVSSQGVMMHRTTGIHYAVGAFTNISPDHIGPGEHSSFEEYLDYKTKMFDYCDKGLVNKDDEHADYVLNHSNCKQMYTLGTADKSDFTMKRIRYVAEGSFVGVEFDLTGGGSQIDCRVGIPAVFNAYNGAVAISICKMLGIDDDVLSHGLEHIHVNGRMEIAYASDKFTVIIDYAHNAISMESLLTALREYHPKRLVVVFGCGGNRSKDRRYSMGEIGGKYADLSIVTEDNSRFEEVGDIIADIESTLKPTGGEYITIPDRKEAINYAIHHAQQGDMIAIIGKGHEDYQEIKGVRHHFLDREVVDEAIAKGI